jgi:hypothetical protein
VIIAVPQQSMGEFHPMGGTGAVRLPPYKALITWHTWFCTTCRVASKPGNLWQGAASALQMGEHHEGRAQCQRLGQLELFSLAGGAR